MAQPRSFRLSEKHSALLDETMSIGPVRLTASAVIERGIELVHAEMIAIFDGNKASDADPDGASAGRK